MSPRAFDDAADFVSADQVCIEHNACSLGLLPGFSLEFAVPDPLFLGPVPSRYRAHRQGVVAGDRLKDGDHLNSYTDQWPAETSDARSRRHTGVALR